MQLSIQEISAKLKNKEITAIQLTEDALQKAKSSALNAYNLIDSEGALLQAAAADAAIKSGKGITPLTGIPVGIKDNFCIDGMRTTCSSKMLENYIPPYSSTVTEKLQRAGAVIIGKTNMDEFAMGATNETSIFGGVANPVNKQFVAGGSSGGSAAAVGEGSAVFALGSDTGGSVRLPASVCGVVGLKPTYGTVSRFGVVPVAASLDTVGILTRTVKDCADVLDVISGYDKLDSTSKKMDYPKYSDSFTGSVKGLKIGVSAQFFDSFLNGEIKKAVENALQFYKDSGAQLIDVQLPHSAAGISAYYIISCAEAASSLARFDGVKYGYRTESFNDLSELYVNSRTEGFGEEIKRRIMFGNYVLSSEHYDDYFLQAQKVRALIVDDLKTAFEKCDLIMGPTTPYPAVKFGEKPGQPLKMNLADVYTVAPNLAGLPALSLPCGKDGNGIPVGLHIVGKAFDEPRIFNAADVYQNAEGQKWITK